MESQTKLKTRLSTLNMFGKFSANKPPPPPPKDNWYLQSKASASMLSFASSSLASSSRDQGPGAVGATNNQLSPVSGFSVMASQSQYNLALPRTMSPTPSTSASTISMNMSAASASTYSVNTLSTETSAAASSAGSTFRRGLSKLSAFGKRSLFGGKGQSAAAKANRQWEIDQQERGLRSDVGDDGEISRPYDVSHDLHVDEELSGLPPEWIDSLRKKGYTDMEIMAKHRRHRQTYLQNHPDLSPVTTAPPWPPVPSLSTTSLSASSSSPTSTSSPTPMHIKLSQPSSLSTRSNVPPPLQLSPTPQVTLPLNLSREGSPNTYGRGRAHRENSSAYTLSVASTIRNGGPPPHIDDPYESEYAASVQDWLSSETGSGSGIGAGSVTNDNATHRTASSVASADIATDADLDTDYASVPPSTPPRTPARTFRVVNASPASPPPAYAVGEAGVTGADTGASAVEVDAYGYRRDVKVDPAGQQVGSSRGKSVADNERERGPRTGLRLDLQSDSNMLDLERMPKANRERDVSKRGHRSRPSVASVASQTDPVEELGVGTSSGATLPKPNRNISLPPVFRVDSPPREARTLELPTLELSLPSTSSSFATPERSRQNSQDSLSPDHPLITPVKRAPVKPPRLSLHQDLSSDLSSWSASLFSVLGGEGEGEGSGNVNEGTVESAPSKLGTTKEEEEGQDVTSAPTTSISVPSISSAIAAGKAKASEPTSGSLSASASSSSLHRSGSVSGLSIRSKSGKLPAAASSSPPKLLSSVEAQLQGPSTPLFEEVMSLMQESNSPIDVSCLLASISRPPSTYTTNPATPTTPESPKSPVSIFTPPKIPSDERSSGRDSQQTIGAASRWSDATIVRDAVVARPVPATFIATTTMAKPAGNTTGVGARPQEHLSEPSPETCRDSSFSVSEFPMPPPSPIYSPYDTPPHSPSANGNSLSVNVNLNGPPPPPSAYALRRLPPRSSSLRSNGSSESESSTTSSPMKPLSVADSDSSHEYTRVKVKSPNEACHGPLTHGEAAIAAAEWGKERGEDRGKDLPKLPQEDVQGDAEDVEARAEQVEVEVNDMEGYGAACVLDDWLLDSPTAGAYGRADVEMAKVLVAGDTSVNSTKQTQHVSQPSSNIAQKPAAQDGQEIEVDEASPLPLEFELNGDLLPPRSRNSSTRIRKGIVSTTVNRFESQQKGMTHKAAASSSSASLSSSGHSSSHGHSQPSSRSGSVSPPKTKSIWTACSKKIAEALEPLREFIDDSADPRTLFADMQEIAEGESGSVYVARVVRRSEHANKSRSPIGADQGEYAHGKMSFIAIKNVPVPDDGSPKVDDLRKELVLMSCVRHANILSMDALYVDLLGKALWIEMELMERSLADVLALVGEGLVLQEGVIARMTSDILHALAHLETLGIAHRDVRSDNLLVNNEGVLKMADFSHATQYDNVSPMRRDVVGVVYWQAPEIRHGPYDVRKVDTWSVGATVWEMVESEPPFMEIDDPRQIPDQWPNLSQPELYSRSLHEFIRYCSLHPGNRPDAKDLLMTSFIRGAAPRNLVVQLLTQCRDIEDRIHRRQSVDSQGTVQA